MNKSGHLMITEHLAEKLCARHRFCLKLGSILPDILVYTYIVGHTWESSCDRIREKMERLAAYGEGGCASFLSLGYIVHYIEDYFTWPHNTWYTGNLAEHVQYEKVFSEYIRERSVTELSENESTKNCLGTADSMIDFLSALHQQYEKEKAGFENDYRYISKAAEKIIHGYLQIFVRNRQAAEAAVETEDMVFQVAGRTILHK